jgi:hypothetical protein
LKHRVKESCTSIPKGHKWKYKTKTFGRAKENIKKIIFTPKTRN